MNVCTIKDVGWGSDLPQSWELVAECLQCCCFCAWCWTWSPKGQPDWKLEKKADMVKDKDNWEDELKPTSVSHRLQLLPWVICTRSWCPSPQSYICTWSRPWRSYGRRTGSSSRRNISRCGPTPTRWAGRSVMTPVSCHSSWSPTPQFRI